MARAAVLELLRGDATLAGLGGTGFVVVPQHEADQAPNLLGGFLVICWRHTDFDEDIQDNAEQHFDVYAHWPVPATPGGVGSTDFGRVNSLLDRVDAIFRAACNSGEPFVGSDGLRLDYIGFEGRGMDVKDDGYQTICRPASYMALSSNANA
ncbi:hypothetical protein EV580_1316 [Mycobacterium sp. BK086]|uniref:hypothetical protein n=1 Tax=Mycobacterium sp. BK086 TaxID=2512165 RepID=UPI00105E3F02|nr:hypothetical protein [Mycobacterium sp. BK086]TDO18134.1 hypothetical protein EV580_1316 [Mycobacterium sp. BK086]